MSAMMRTLILLLTLLLLIPAQTTHAQTFGLRSVGYIGCSNTWMSDTGYQHLPANHLWPVYNTDSGEITQWADPSSAFWTKFDTMLTTYRSTTTAIWVQLCEQVIRDPTDYAHVQQMVVNLQQHAPGLTYYISAINSYTPLTLCGLMGPNGRGVTDTQAWARQAVTDGYGLAGPAMGPLDSTTTTTDGCHPNAAGQQLLGQQLFAFFDAASPTATPTATVPATPTPTATSTAVPTATSTAVPTATPTATPLWINTCPEQPLVTANGDGSYTVTCP